MTRQQRWAAAAFEAVSRLKTAGAPDAEKKYATHCMKAPTLLRQAGLVQTLAFLRSRGDGEQGRQGRRYADDLAASLAAADDTLKKALAGQELGKSLLQCAQKLALREYMALSRDAAAVAVWMRRFAQAELKQED